MKKVINKLKSLSAGTIFRTILQVLVYLNQFVILLGKSPLGSNPIYIWVSFGFTLVITAMTYWFNNDWSKAAQIADDVFEILKDGKVTKEEVEEFINKHKGSKDKDIDK